MDLESYILPLVNSVNSVSCWSEYLHDSVIAELPTGRKPTDTVHEEGEN